MRRLVREEGGYAVVFAFVMMTVLLGAMVGIAALVDEQQEQASTTRQRETSFNVAETAYTATLTRLHGAWPGTAGEARPVCTPASTDTRCPQQAAIEGLFPVPEAGSRMTWTTQVRDNDPANPSFYRADQFDAAPAWDANADGKVWIRSAATVDGQRTRTVVGLAERVRTSDSFPRRVLLTGRLDFGNDGFNGNKRFIVAQGADPPAVATRCTPQVGESSACFGAQMKNDKDMADLKSDLDVAIEPNTTDPATPVADVPALSDAARARLLETATRNGTVFSTCPPTLSGAVVWIRNAGACAYSNGTWNAPPAKPGILVLDNTTLSFNENGHFYGVLYHLGNSATQPVMDIKGTVHGALFADGATTVVRIGGAGDNIIFDPAALGMTFDETVATNEITWREVTQAG